jgi:hypothetical protein
MEQNIGLLKVDMSIEMRMLRLVYCHTRRECARNDDICQILGVAPVEEKFIQNYVK